MFNEISDATYGEAGDIVRGAAGRGRAPIHVAGIEDMAHLVAASAVALERGAPNLIYESRSAAERYLEQGTREWRMLHAATARVIDQARSGNVVFEEPSDVVTHMVADVHMQASHERLKLAIDNRDFESRLTEQEKRIVGYARDDEDVARDIADRSIGVYHKLDSYAQGDLRSELVTGSDLTPELKREIEAVVVAAGLVREPDVHFVREFEAVRPESIRKVDAFLREGTSTGSPQVEDAIKAHARLHEVHRGFGAMATVDGVDTADAESLVARARALQEFSSSYASSEHIAVRIEADRRMMLAGREAETQIDASPSASSIALGRYHDLDDGGRERMSKALDRGENVPPVEAVCLAVFAREAGAERERDRSLVVQRQAAMAAASQARSL